MIEQVNFSRITNFTGRNGFMKCGGIDLLEHSDTIILSALTSKHCVARCDIYIPTEDLPTLIVALQKFVTKKESSCPPS